MVTMLFALMVGAWGPVPAWAPKPLQGEPLGEAVRAFNLQAAADEVGRNQPPLTEDEVVAAIKWMCVDRPTGTSDQEMGMLREIVDTQRIPAGVLFAALNRFEPDDRTVFNAWSVRIVVPKADGGTHAFVIRDRWISSRTIGPDERGVIRRWQDKWRKQGGITSFDRAIYDKERRDAEERDRRMR